MKYIDGFRNPRAAAVLRESIAGLGARLDAEGRCVRIMEVCGTHTMAIARYGIRQLLPRNVELVSGPGCPVCVTPPGYIDAAIELAESGATVVTFGDMVHVPGSSRTLADARTRGARIDICYSPAKALSLAGDAPDRRVVFLAIGFETTIAPVVGLVDAAMERNLDNLSLLTAFKCVPPALRALLADPEIRIDALLCPAHVSAIIGADAYAPFAGEHGVPCVIAGFEPLDILLGLRGVLEQAAARVARVDNQYSRVVKPGGNPVAQRRMARLLRPAGADWRGLGFLPESGLALRDGFARFDAAAKFGIEVKTGAVHKGCLCGDVIKGKLRPGSCPMFRTGCSPDHPLGPCMVSAEGTCAAAYKYE